MGQIMNDRNYFIKGSHVAMIFATLFVWIGSACIGAMYYNFEKEKVNAVKEIEIAKVNALANVACMDPQKFEPKNSNVRRNRRK